MFSILRLTPEAKLDIQDFWRYTAAEWGMEQADAYKDAVVAACFSILEYPQMGQCLEPIHPNVRMVRCRQHFIVYLNDSAGVVFLGFLHERMQMLQHLKTRLS